MITKEDLGRMLFNNEKVAQLLKERDAYRQVAIKYVAGSPIPIREYESTVDAEAQRILKELI